MMAHHGFGQLQIDPKSYLEDFQTDMTRRFDADPAAQKQLAETVTLASVSAENYDAVFYPGGHGPLWDLYQDKHSIALIESFFEQGKPVAAVCHAPAVLFNAKNSAGEPIVKGKEVTGFSNSEEAAVGLTDVVPYLLEDALKEQGGNYKSVGDWQSFALQDGLLITGQNPGSSAATAELVLRHYRMNR
jgi:putative intracellular protease/amidase